MAEQKHKIFNLNKEVEFYTLRTKNLESYKSLYNTLRAAMGTQARYQANINQQIEEDPDTNEKTRDLVKQSEQGNRSLVHLIGENLSDKQKQDEANQLEDKPPSEPGFEEDPEISESLSDKLAEQRETIKSLQERLARGEINADELEQVEGLLTSAHEENQRLKEKLTEARASIGSIDAVKNDLYMTRARIQILESDKQRLLEARDTLSNRVEILDKENDTKYKKMISLAKRLAKSGATPASENSFKLKQELADKDKKIKQKSEEYDRLRQEFVELETLYLQMASMKKRINSNSHYLILSFAFII